MTTNPPSNDEPRDDRSPEHGDDGHTCYNCFAEFSWEPTIHDGEEFCCAGCVEGGPCICTYEGPPQPVEEVLAPTAVASEMEPEARYRPMNENASGQVAIQLNRTGPLEWAGLLTSTTSSSHLGNRDRP